LDWIGLDSRITAFLPSYVLTLHFFLLKIAKYDTFSFP